MTTIAKQQAVERLTQAISEARPDDLVEIYNELFPEEPTTEDDANRAPSVLVKKVMAHVDCGLEVQEILDLWNVIFPIHRRVWYDEEEGVIHYDEEIESVGRTD